MGRRRQHNGGLALSSDQIPGRAQNNIRPGLVILSAPVLPGLSHTGSTMLLQTVRKGKPETNPACASRPAGKTVAGEKRAEPHGNYRKTSRISRPRRIQPGLTPAFGPQRKEQVFRRQTIR
jgi:hypothetical protein